MQTEKLLTFVAQMLAKMAKDIYHNCVRNALEKDGWKITDDPLDLIFDSETETIVQWIKS